MVVPVITRITTQKKSSERFNVFLKRDDAKEEYGFSVNQDVLIRFHLRKGLELSDELIEQLLEADHFQKAYQTGLKYLGFKMRSVKEVRDELVRKEYSKAVAEQVIEKLVAAKFLDDREYGIAYVRTQMRTTLKGPGVIKGELAAKGLDGAEIAAGIAEYSKELQIENATKLAFKKANQNQKNSPKQTEQKVKLHLVQKGYSQEIVNAALEGIDTGNDEEAKWAALIHQGEKAHRRYQKFEGWEYEKRMKQALYRKGFSLEEIDAYLRGEAPRK